MAIINKKEIMVNEPTGADSGKRTFNSVSGKVWDTIRLNWKVSGSIMFVLLVAIIAGLTFQGRNKAQIKTIQSTTAQNQLKQQFLDQLPALQAQAQNDPNNPSLQQQLGVAKYATGDLQGAQQSYEKAVQLDSKNAVLHNNLGNTERDLADYAKAETEYRLAMQLNPKLTTPYMNLGSIYQYILGKPDTALQVYAEGIKNNPDYVDFYNATAAIYEQQGLKAKAVSSFQQALKVQPGNPAATAGLKRLQ